jgi:HK97 family phage major capsid protein
MKIKREAWKAIKAFARSEGYEGSGKNADVLAWLTDEEGYETLTLKAYGLENLDLKRLEIELSEDGSQALITEVMQEQEDDEDDEEKEGDEEEEEEKAYDQTEIDQKIAAEVERRVGNVASKRPAVGLAAIGEVVSSEEREYQKRIENPWHRTAFDSPYEAKLFALNLCRNVARRGSRQLFGPGADSPEAYFKRFDSEYTKMIESAHPRAKALRAQAKAYSKAQQKALDSSTSNLTGIEFSATLIRNVEEYGVAPRLSPITTMTEMQQESKKRTGGVTITYAGENQAATESSPTYEAKMLTAKEGIGLSKVSRMAVRSATIDLADSVMTEHGQAWAEHIDDAFFKGDGTSTYSGRIGLSRYTGSGAYFGTTATDGGYIVTGAGDVSSHTAAQLAKLIGRVPLYAQRNMVITGLNQFLSSVFHRLGAAQGGATLTEWQGMKVSSYAGFPLIPNFSMAHSTDNLGADGIDFLAGDFSRGTEIGYFGSLEVDVSEERYFDQNSIAIRSVLPWDFVVTDVGTSTAAGPIVSFWQDHA